MQSLETITKMDIGDTPKESNVIFKISGSGLLTYIFAFPVFALVSCVILSLVNDFHSSTKTHCGVDNYLPSISSAIDYTPQRYIWRVCMALHCAPRLVTAIGYYNHYMAYPPIHRSRVRSLLARLNSILAMLEMLLLLVLSYVSATENFSIHEKSFVGFIIVSQLHMLLSVVLLKQSRSQAPMSVKDKKSYNWKFSIAIFNIVMFLMAVYIYIRHNTYCEPGMYTAFAFAEYLVVATNVAFHCMFIPDLGTSQLTFVHERPKVL